MMSALIYTQILFFGILYSVSAVLFMILYSFCVFFRPEKVRKMMRCVILGLGHVTVRIAVKPYIRVITEQNGDASSLPASAVYLCNHRAASDAFLVSEIKTARPAFQIMKSWPMQLPFLGLCARIGGYFSMEGLSYEMILQKCRRLLLEEKSPLIVYPEGTRSGSRELGQFHGTFFRVAKDLDLPVVPVAIAGNEKIPDLKFKLHPGRIRIKVLETIPAETVRELSLFKLKVLVRTMLLKELEQLDERLDAHE